MKYVCNWCGHEFKAAPSQKRKFCNMDCCYQFQSKILNPEGYHRRPHLSEINRKLNPYRMTADVKAKLSLLKLGTGKRKSYIKLNGRHIHRTIAEMKIGRELKNGEVVHHIDGNIRNNDPDNLEIIVNQNEHARIHMRRRNNSEGK